MKLRWQKIYSLKFQWVEFSVSSFDQLFEWNLAFLGPRAEWPSHWNQRSRGGKGFLPHFTKAGHSTSRHQWDWNFELMLKLKRIDTGDGLYCMGDKVWKNLSQQKYKPKHPCHPRKRGTTQHNTTGSETYRTSVGLTLIPRKVGSENNWELQRVN